ncbi:hypothetical protein [Pseudomonas sp. LW8]|uniref:hypothetical protein n=1 Tax=Pseudomonas sp. LW8 TaxID=3242677 RepID=UPI0035C1FE76
MPSSSESCRKKNKWRRAKELFAKSSEDFPQNDPMSPAWMWEAADIGFFQAAIELDFLDTEIEPDAHSTPIRTKTPGSGYFIGAGWRSAGERRAIH